MIRGAIGAGICIGIFIVGLSVGYQAGKVAMFDQFVASALQHQSQQLQQDQ